MPGSIVANPNLQILSFQRGSIVVAPFVEIFRFGIIGWQAEGPTVQNQTDFGQANRVGMQMPYSGFIHQWSVKHGGYPNQQQGQWKWVLGHNFAEADSFIDVANPTQPFDPGPGVHERQVFSKVIGETDQPFPFVRGDFLWFALGMLQGLFTVTRTGSVTSTVSVMIEFIRK